MVKIVVKMDKIIRIIEFVLVCPYLLQIKTSQNFVRLGIQNLFTFNM